MKEPFVDWASGQEVGGFSRASSEEQQYLLEKGLVAQHVREMYDNKTQTNTEPK